MWVALGIAVLLAACSKANGPQMAMPTTAIIPLYGPGHIVELSAEDRLRFELLGGELASLVFP